MDNFQKKFREEAEDLVNGLESLLLKLDADKNNGSIIEEIFRTMHSLKGGGAMFGFNAVSDFTHNLESIYDLVRAGKLAVSKELLNTTLESIDLIKILLENKPELSQNDKSLFTEIEAKINSFIGGEKSTTRKDSNFIAHKTEVTDGTSYYILFEPRPQIMNNGTNPLYLVDELVTSGTAFVKAHHLNLPPLEKLNPLNCYTSWEIVIFTKLTEEQIRDVFLFVEDESHILIDNLGKTNILESLKFSNYLNSISESTEYFDLQTLTLKLNNADDIEQLTFKADYKLNALQDNQITSIRVDSEKLDNLMNLVSELVTTQAALNLYTEANKDPKLLQINESLENITRHLRDLAFNVSLLPIETLNTRFRRLVRDLGADLGKEIEFETTGTETELDKSIIQSVTDPIMHILRNCIDHGIEMPAERTKKGKPAKGLIKLSANYTGNTVRIIISDDGAGINEEAVLAKAIANDLFKGTSKLTHEEIVNLILLPGFSTAKRVTDISGRGVGLDVVKRKITEIRGDLEIKSEPNKGTSITIILPLTLSIIDGLLIDVNKYKYIVQLSVIDKIYALDKNQLGNTKNKIIILDDEQIPYSNLREIFEFEPHNTDIIQMLVVKYENRKAAIIVDDVLGEHQAVVKPLGKLYRGQDFISGATILGDGTVALVLDTNKIIKQLSNN
ncbi:MAG TPA: chemotaxis protein CheA [Bacteroidales bacterium]|nr:chemotaxis protein CheA [Bacteroidales bacterium]